MRRACLLLVLAVGSLVACEQTSPTETPDASLLLTRGGAASELVCHLTDGLRYGTVRVVAEPAVPEHMVHGDCLTPEGTPGDPCGCPIRIEADIDGRSRLILSGETAQWHHFDYAAPGRLDSEFYGCPSDPPPLPTLINGEEWYPQWPDVPDAENRNCNCTSDTYEGLGRRLPQTDLVPVLNRIQHRWPPAIVQYPSEANGYTTIIEFNDNGYSCAATYIVELGFR